ncbi:MAG: hypothetical protein QOJ07_1610, partial [Thermoleophilaceae bacterium]|nr:hypothetical protein [Thermoleophilaceae bacterium]
MANSSVRDDLLERGSDVESMLAAAAAARDGAGRLLAIVGPAGIGKTRLLGELVGRSDELGLQVLRARAGEFEVAFPFGVARQLVEPELARAGASERAELLAGAAALAQEALEGTPPREGAAADPSFAALHGLFWLTANLAARGPLLIVVDDAHWCDPPSLRWLSYLSRRLEGMPVLLAMSWRPAEPGSDTTTLDDLASDPATVVVRPQPLSVEAAGRIVDERVGVEADPAFVLACHEVTGGNPYLLGEVASMAVADGLGATTADADRVRRLGPGSISRWVLRRLRRLGPAAVALAFAVAVLEGDADLRQLVALSGLEAAEIAAVADSLVRGAILRRERPLEFAHPILREAVYADIGPIER